MSTKRRIEKLEQATVGSSRLYFLGVHVPENQSKQVALERALADAGLSLEQVGLLMFVGPRLHEYVDCGGYAHADDLLGYREFWAAVMASCATNPKNSIRGTLRLRREASQTGSA